MIPAQVTARYMARSRTIEGLEALEPRIRACFEAGALASGCTVSYEELSPVYTHMEADARPAGPLPAQCRGSRPHLRGRSTPMPRCPPSRLTWPMSRWPCPPSTRWLASRPTGRSTTSTTCRCLHHALGRRRRARRCAGHGLDRHRCGHRPGPAPTPAERMITEHVVLPVIPGKEDEFMATMEQAKIHHRVQPRLRVPLSRTLHRAAQPVLADWCTGTRSKTTWRASGDPMPTGSGEPAAPLL